MTTSAKNKKVAGVSSLSEGVGACEKIEQAAAKVTATSAANAELPPDRRTGFTMCPNWVYDFLLVEESPSIIKVVLFFNRNTTGRTDLKGRRIEFKQATYKNIASRMKMSVRAVGEAMRTALARGYLVQRRPVTGPGENSEGKPCEKSPDKPFFEGDFYALNWNWPLSYVTPSKVNETPVIETSSQEALEEKTTLCEITEKPETLVANLSAAIYSPPEPILVENQPVSPAPQSLFLRRKRQVLPGEKRQILPACINKADKDKKNKEIGVELKSSSTVSENSSICQTGYETGRQFNSTVTSSDQTGPVQKLNLPRTKVNGPPRTGRSQARFSCKASKPNSKANSGPQRRGSSAIGLVIKDLTREFGDNQDLLLPNISRALNLWQTTALDEKAFLDLIYQARQKARACSTISHRRNSDKTPSTGGLTNRMPYFYAVLSELSALSRQTETGCPSPAKEISFGAVAPDGHSPALPGHPPRRPGPQAASKITSPGETEIPRLSEEFTGAETFSTSTSIFNDARELNRDLTSIWQGVCEALRGRFQKVQLAEAALRLILSRGATRDQLVLSAPTLPWLTKSFTSSDIAVFKLALRQFTGGGFELLLG